jgi:ankyrin repeat protein
MLDRFFKAAEHSDVQTLTEMLDNEPALISAVDETRGWTALHYAKQPQAVRLLLSRGADPMARDRAGATPLHVASDFLSAELIMLAGGDPEAEDLDGLSPLSWALETRGILFFEMLARGQFNYHFLRLSPPRQVEATLRGERQVFTVKTVTKDLCEALRVTPSPAEPVAYEVSLLTDLRFLEVSNFAS